MSATSATNWRESTLDTEVNLLSGGTPKTSIKEYWDGDIPWLSVADFNKPNRWVDTAEKSITELGVENSATTVLEPGDLIISARGTVGALAQVKRKMAFNQSCYGLRAKNTTTNDFLFYLVKSKINELRRKVHGAVFDTITRETFQQIQVLMPDINEQRSIAAILSSLDNKIELLRKQNETLEQTAQAIFNEKFVKAEEELPAGWRVGVVNDFAKILSGFAFKSSDFDADGKYGLVTIKNVQSGYFVEQTTDKLSSLPAKMPQYCLLQSGDILLSLTGNVGRLCYVVGEDYVLNQRVAKIQPINEKDFAYTYIFFRQPSLLAQLERVASGTAQQNLSPIKTGELETIIPQRDVLDVFAEVANPLVSKMQQNSVQIRKLSSVRDLLLPKLISGEIRVQL